MTSSRSALEKDTKPNAGYIAFHRPRFTFLIDVLRHNVRATDARILDIGRSYLTTMMYDELGTRTTPSVWSLTRKSPPATTTVSI